MLTTPLSMAKELKSLVSVTSGYQEPNRAQGGRCSFSQNGGAPRGGPPLPRRYSPQFRRCQRSPASCRVVCPSRGKVGVCVGPRTRSQRHPQALPGKSPDLGENSDPLSPSPAKIRALGQRTSDHSYGHRLWRQLAPQYKGRPTLLSPTSDFLVSCDHTGGGTQGDHLASRPTPCRCLASRIGQLWQRKPQSVGSPNRTAGTQALLQKRVVSSRGAAAARHAPPLSLGAAGRRSPPPTPRQDLQVSAPVRAGQHKPPEAPAAGARRLGPCTPSHGSPIDALQ
ncbi:hypothetical protein NDU88_003656 [Pleurodeles waltl]|uniref:Uncharacterized protein n=1 Tax=Pleurodeles waltl TaxID=8319 RepID=A0AAV7VIF4_PLEWA|nr:hypothetical protein NDU88_003656 [Pleurodeles waltl]